MNWTERQFLQRCLLTNTRIFTISDSALQEDTHNQLLPLKRFLVNEESRQDVTVIIPTHRRIPLGLEAWKLQCDHVWILKNGPVSISDTNIKIVECNWTGHGSTRQSIVEDIQTPYVFFTVDDAIPLANTLSNLIETLEASTFDAVVSRQIPFPTANPITRNILNNWTPSGIAPYVVSQTDHVGTLYRTMDLLKDPIPDVPIAEDACWSIGKSIACDPRATLVHSHPRKLGPLVKREFSIHRQLSKIDRSDSLGFREAIWGGISQIPDHGVQEGALSIAQNLARFAAQRF